MLTGQLAVKNCKRVLTGKFLHMYACIYILIVIILEEGPPLGDGKRRTVSFHLHVSTTGVYSHICAHMCSNSSIRYQVLLFIVLFLDFFPSWCTSAWGVTCLLELKRVPWVEARLLDLRMWHMFLTLLGGSEDDFWRHWDQICVKDQPSGSFWVALRSLLGRFCYHPGCVGAQVLSKEFVAGYKVSIWGPYWRQFWMTFWDFLWFAVSEIVFE